VFWVYTVGRVLNAYGGEYRVPKNAQHSSWLVVGKLMNKFDLNQITNKYDINQLLLSQIIYLESILKMNTSKINY
jgi:hypothetical protein